MDIRSLHGFLARWSRAGLLATGTLGLLGAAASCTPATAPNFGDRALGKRSESVIVDYYAGTDLLRSCTGTLLSSNVVVAPAHCADGSTKATVIAANASRTRSSVSRMYTYDWVSADRTMKASNRHDVSLLVLRRPVEGTHIAKIQKQPAATIQVSQIGRARSGSRSILSISRPVQLGVAGTHRTATRIAVEPSTVTARGGAVYRLTSASTDERIIVGLVIGHGQHSGMGVVVPLSDPTMQRWIRAVVKTEKGQTDYTTTAKARTASLRILDDGTDTSPDTSSDPPADTSTDTSAPASDPPEQVDDETAPASADPPADTEAPPSSPPSDDPVVSAPADPSTSDPGTSADPGASAQPSDPGPADPSTPAQPSDPGTPDPSSPASPADPGASADPSMPPSADGTPSSSDPVVLTGTSTPETAPDPSATPAGSSPTTPDAAASGDPSSYDDTKAADPTASADPSATPASADPSAPAASDKPNDTAPAWPGTIAGVGPLRAPADGETTTLQPSGNAVTVAQPGDPAFADDAKLAQKYAGTANVYNSHGAPGTLVGGVPAETMQSFLSDGKPLIVASCFSAAPMTGGSTIRRVVSTYGDDPSVASRVYGCSGYASGDDAGGLGCTGTWLDANGHAVPQDERTRLNLNQYQCSTNTLDGNGQPVWSDCASNN